MHALGRHVEHDERSRAFALVPVATKPVTLQWPIDTPILDQGQVGSCTGNALAQWLNTRFAKQGTDRVLTELHALKLYSAATRRDNIPGAYPPDDTGSSGLAVCKAGVSAGYLHGYKHVFGFKALLLALQHTPVIVGTDWYEGMFTPDKAGLLSVTGAIAGGHEYLVRGCDVERKRIIMTNSWSGSWGIHGSAYISFTDFERLLAASGDVTVPVRA